jgi:hypothetical protein
LLLDQRIRNAAEVAERFADGRATEDELYHANRRMKFEAPVLEAAAVLLTVRSYDRPSVLHRYGIVDLTLLEEGEQGRLESICSSGLRFPAEAALAVALRAGAVNSPGGAAGHAALLRDIFGPFPFRPVTIAPALLRWNSRLIPRLAEAVYEERILPGGQLDPQLLAVLSDAVEDAGCQDAELLGHLRGPGPHVRGCWAADALLATTTPAGGHP